MNKRRKTFFKGKQYATAKDFEIDLHVAPATAYRIMKKDFANKTAKWHKYYTRLKIDGQKVPIWGIYWPAYLQYLTEREIDEQMDKVFQENIEDFTNIVIKEDGSLSISGLLKELYDSEMSAGETISQLETQVENIAVKKVVNPFTGRSGFARGKTYDEYATWIKSHELEESPLKTKMTDKK